MRFLILNAIVPPVKAGGMLVSPPFSWDDVVQLVDALKAHPDTIEVISAVGHPATAELLGVPCSRVEVHPEPGDVAIVARLKKRAAGDVSDLTHEDLEFRLVRYGPAACDDSRCFLMSGFHPDTFMHLFE